MAKDKKKEKKTKNPKAWSPTVMQQKFVDAYEGNATEAARIAGYSAKTVKSQGQRLLTNVDLFKAIEKRLEKEKSARVADRTEREERLSEILRNNRAYKIQNEATGFETIKVDVENREVIKAIDTLNKMDGLYVTKHEVAGKGGGPIETKNVTITSKMTPKEAAALYAQMVKNGD